MPKEFIANFTIEKHEEQATFEIKENTIETAFVIEKADPINVHFEIEQSYKDKYFVFEQSVSSNIWTIHHNLNKHASITVVDEYDRVVDYAAEYVNDNLIILTFNCSFKGKAYLN